jgi:uncharacterized membrane protein YfcA
VTFLLTVALVALLGSGVAAVAGFGIGSLLTPLISARFGMRAAVALVALPHVVATLLRFVKLHGHLERRIFWTFGVANAAGALVGALLHSVASNPSLQWLLAALLFFAGVLSLFRYADRMRFGPILAWPAGALSGVLGGLVGNQGSIRSAAMLGLGLEGERLVATATGIGLIVDAARIPVYVYTDLNEMMVHWPIIISALIGVVIGTYAGAYILQRLSKEGFRRIIGVLLIVISALLLFHPHT